MGSVKTKLNYRGITQKVDNLAYDVLDDLVEKIHDDANEYVPELTGALKESFMVDFGNDGRGVIALVSWNTPYARRQYYEKNNKTVGTDHWLLYMKQENLNRWLREISVKRQVFIMEGGSK